MQPKRELIRPVAVTLSIVFSLAVLSTNGALAQGMQKTAPAQAAPPASQPPTLKQIALTEKQVQGVFAAQKDMDAITDRLPDNSKPDPKAVAQLEATAKKYGFASFGEYADVTDNISLVMGGIDPATRKYLGSDAVIKQQMAGIHADKKMKAEDKKEALASLDLAMKTQVPEVENKGNIDLVIRNYDKLAAALAGEDTK